MIDASARRPPLRVDRHQRVFLPLLAGLVVFAWAVLWVWASSPYGRYLEHDGWALSGPAGALCRAIPGGEVLVPLVLYAAAWILMTAAMMLPTTLPLFDTFARITTGRQDQGRLLLLLGAGYMAVWGAFGILAHGLHTGLLALLASHPALAWNGWMIGSATIAFAGLFQFSRLKYQCLDKCRSPFSFVVEHWHGQGQARQAFALGMHHGLFCVGCCWALMLLMFAFGMGSPGWMLLLSAAMAIEKNVRWGRRLSAPLGVTLLAWAGMLVVTNS